jgi:kynurenine formamidase
VASLAEPLLELLGSGVKVFDLGRPMFNGMPQSPNHPPFRSVLQRRHGDHVRADGGSAASDLLVTGTHVGTHIDAFSHVSQDGKLFGGVDADESQRGGRFKEHGIDTVEPIFCRGVMLDIPASLGVDACEAAYEITAGDLQKAIDRQGTSLNKGDVALVRTGWARNWDDPIAYFGMESGVPGPAEEGAKLLASFGIRAAGADTIAFEHQAPGAGHAFLPAHRVFLVEQGIHIIETMYLEELASEQIYEFLFILAPLKLVGATGSPVRPLAVVSNQ